MFKKEGTDIKLKYINISDLLYKMYDNIFPLRVLS